MIGNSTYIGCLYTAAGAAGYIAFVCVGETELFCYYNYVCDKYLFTYV